MRTSRSLIAFVLLLLPAQVVLSAGVAVLDAVPDNAMGLVVIRNLGELDSKITAQMSRMSIPPVSSLMLLKGTVEIVEGIDEKESVAVAFMSTTDSVIPGDHLLVFVPTTDQAKMLAFINPQPVEEGYQKVTLMGKETFVGTRGKYTVFGSSLSAVKSAVSAKKTIRKKLTENQIKRIEADDVSFHIDFEAFSADPLWATMAMGAAFTGNDINVYKDRYNSWGFSLSLTDKGLQVVVAENRKKKITRIGGSSSDSPLLLGIPAESYLFAMGYREENGLSGFMQEFVEGIVGKLTTGGEIDPAKKQQLLDHLRPLVLGTRQASSSIVSLPETPDGLVGFAKVVETTGPAKDLLKHYRRLIEFVKADLATDPQVQMLLKRISYEEAAEKVGDMEIDHLKIDLSAIQKIDETLLTRVVGQEGLLVRIGVVNNRYAVACLGGGLARFEKIVQLTKESKAPLAKDQSIMNASKRFPKVRQAVAFLYADRFVELIRTVMRVTDQPNRPPEMKATAEPATLVVHKVDTDEQEVIAFIPQETILSVKEFMDRIVARNLSSGGVLP